MKVGSHVHWGAIEQIQSLSRKRLDNARRVMSQGPQNPRQFFQKTQLRTSEGLEPSPQMLRDATRAHA